MVHPQVGRYRRRSHTWGCRVANGGGGEVVVWMCAEKFGFVARAKHKLGKLMCGDQVVPGGRVLWHHIFFEF